MANSIKEKIAEDLQKAKAEGQLRTERIREIVKEAVKDAVSDAVTEVKQGAGEIRELVKDAIATVVENLKDKNREIRDEIVASVQGAIEGISDRKRQNILQAKEEVRLLQENIERQEQELDAEIDAALVNVEPTDSETADKLKSAIASTIQAIRESDEAALMQKRYAQLQAQLSILKANIEARYGDNYDEVKNNLINKYLEEAKNWYRESQKWAESDTEKTLLEHKQVEIEKKVGEAGNALARKERQVLQILRELWFSITDRDAKTPENASKS